MELVMEFLNNVFGEGGDLAGIASAAGLGGGAASAGAVLFFRGVMVRFVVRILLTAVATGVGFLLLLNQLGFEIVPKEEVLAARAERYEQYSESLVGPESFRFERPKSRVEEAEEEGKRVVIVRRPWEKH